MIRNFDLRDFEFGAHALMYLTSALALIVELCDVSYAAAMSWLIGIGNSIMWLGFILNFKIFQLKNFQKNIPIYSCIYLPILLNVLDRWAYGKAHVFWIFSHLVYSLKLKIYFFSFH